MKATDPAFPVVYKDSADVLRVHTGLSKREYLAIELLKSMSAIDAWREADALISASESKADRQT